MALDEPSAQLHRELRDAQKRDFATSRPVIHHLNADTSWLLQVPRPENAIRRGARFYYNILIDPWFRGGQSDVASWFSQQFHATPSAVQSAAELEDLILETEILAAGLWTGGGRRTTIDVAAELGREETLIDAVAVSHEFTDHCHKETLLELHKEIPVFAIREAARLIDSWKHFRSVNIVDVFGESGDTDWRSTSTPPLPQWIGISRLLQTDDVLNYHAALMFAFNNRHGNGKVKLAKLSGSRKRQHATIEPNEDEESAEAVIYTPHGLHSGDLAIIPSAQPPISTLAFLHGLHNVRVGTASGRTALQSNLGAHNGLKAQRLLKANYWIGTHDEVKKGGGLVAWFLQRDVLTLKDALEQEKRHRQNGAGGEADGDFGELVGVFDNTNWLDLKNGESRILE